MSKARSLSNLFSGSTDAATDAEVTAAISTHATAANGHVGRGNTASRPASPTLGDTYFDTTLDTLIMYASTGWVNIAPTPNPPTSVVATQLTATTASIAFTAPTTGPTANSYIVTSSGAHTGNGSSSPITVTGLTFGSSYTFTVQSVGANGAGNASTASSSITMGLPSVTGGTLASDSTYYYRIFTSTNNLVVTKGNVSMDVIAIAGGGGGGGPATGVYYVHGGGGAGGLRYDASYSAAPGTYLSTVGGGGSGGGDPRGTQGVNSQFGSLTAAVGGGGGSATGNWGGSGGSGGGSTQSLSTTSPNHGTAVSGQGFIGGTGGLAGGGGGGSGGVGEYLANSYPNSYQGGSGGIGTNTYSSWLSAITSSMSGVSGWGTATSGGRIAGGGGGGHSAYYGTPSPYANGGAGGGGHGGAAASGAKASATTAGITNTGGGGGGGGADGTTSTAGATGGSGIVIVRYLKSAVA